MPDYSTPVGDLLETLGRNRHRKRGTAAPQLVPVTQK